MSHFSVSPVVGPAGMLNRVDRPNGYRRVIYGICPEVPKVGTLESKFQVCIGIILTALSAETGQLPLLHTKRVVHK